MSNDSKPFDLNDVPVNIILLIKNKMIK
jgi:hypothetical protein